MQARANTPENVVSNDKSSMTTTKGSLSALTATASTSTQVTQQSTLTTPTLDSPTVAPFGASPATDTALQSTANGNLNIEPIPIGDFVNHVQRKMFEVVMGIRAFSVPYAIFVLTIGGLVLMIPFKMPMQKRLGFGIIGFGMLGFVLIWFGPVLLGIARSMAQP